MGHELPRRLAGGAAALPLITNLTDGRRGGYRRDHEKRKARVTKSKGDEKQGDCATFYRGLAKGSSEVERRPPDRPLSLKTWLNSPHRHGSVDNALSSRVQPGA